MASSHSKEIFFRYNGIYYNCTLDLPTVRYNTVGRAYDVRRFVMRECQNYDTGASVQLPSNRAALKAEVQFSTGVVFHNNNTQISEISWFYSEERIGRPPRPRN